MPADITSLKTDLIRRMDGALDALKREFGARVLPQSVKPLAH